MYDPELFQLLLKIRKITKQKGYPSPWVRDGCILVKECTESNPIQINDINDMDKLQNSTEYMFWQLNYERRHKLSSRFPLHIASFNVNRLITHFAQVTFEIVENENFSILAVKI